MLQRRSVQHFGFGSRCEYRGSCLPTAIVGFEVDRIIQKQKRLDQYLLIYDTISLGQGFSTSEQQLSLVDLAKLRKKLFNPWRVSRTFSSFFVT